jgi:uncharacterized protein YqgC (DUF456 family)
MDEPLLLYYLWVAMLLLASGAAWTLSLFALPGNWLVVGFAALFAWLVPADVGRGVGWITVAVIAGLAVLGEVLELAAGAAGAAKQGASRRSMVLALIGTVIGSICGATVTLPIPLVGPILGALGGGALGAFAGAYLGESWKGRSSQESLAVGKGALLGRLLGTVGKMGVGAVMIVIVTVDALF